MTLWGAFQFSFGIAVICTFLIYLFDLEERKRVRENKISRLRNSSHRRGIR